MCLADVFLKGQYWRSVVQPTKLIQHLCGQIGAINRENALWVCMVLCISKYWHIIVLHLRWPLRHLSLTWSHKQSTHMTLCRHVVGGCVHIYEGECKESWNVSHFLRAAYCAEPAGSIWSVSLSLLPLRDGFPQEWVEEGRGDRCEHVLHNKEMSLWWWWVNGQICQAKTFLKGEVTVTNNSFVKPRFLTFVQSVFSPLSSCFNVFFWNHFPFMRIWFGVLLFS